MSAFEGEFNQSTQHIVDFRLSASSSVHPHSTDLP
jgi:hypothetical protein